MFMLFFGVAMIFISIYSDLFLWKKMVLFWVCGYWRFAETAGDPFRHLSDSTQKSWKIGTLDDPFCFSVFFCDYHCGYLQSFVQ
jgi:hypothetical protein